MLALLLGLVAQTYEPGATFRLYDIGLPMEQLEELVEGQTPNIDKRIDAIDIKNGEFGLADHFYVVVTAEFDAGSGGAFQFRLSCDDGARVWIDDNEVVSDDGVHAPRPVLGRADLTAGWHKVRVNYFEHEGGEELKVEFQAPGQTDFRVMDKSVLRVPDNLTRVVSPGQKSLKALGGPKFPGNGLPLTGLHPGWDLFTCRPDGFEPQVGALAFLPNGRLLVSNFKPNQSGQFLPDVRDGVIYELDGVQGDDRSKIKVRKVAESLQEPLGLAVMDGHVYVSQRTEVSELIDADHDGVYESAKTVAKAWVAENYHHFTFGLAARDGFLYASLSTAIYFGAPGLNGPNPENRGCVMKIDPSRYDPSLPMANVEFVSGGHRTPNGVDFGPEGTVIIGENQGSWQPANKVNIIEPGGFYGHYNNLTFTTPQYPNGGLHGPFDEQPFTEPALYLPQNECANSPGQTVFIPKGPYAGQALVSDVKYGGLRRAWFEKVDGVWQGGAVQYSQGFEVGTNRMVWGPDGALYIGGIGATETWAWTDPATGKWTTFGLQRIKPNGRSVFEIEKVSATPDGFNVRFNRRVDGVAAKDVVVKQWNYEPTPEYGGDKKNRETLEVVRAKLSADGRGLRLRVAGIKPHRVAYLNLAAVRSTENQRLWAAECWYTMNRVPAPLPNRTALAVSDPRVLVFSKTVTFRHDSIAAGQKALAAMFKNITATEDPAVFDDKTLGKFDAVVFLSTTGDVLNPSQQSAMERYIKSGGGFVGVHAAADAEYDWPWHGELVGAWFKDHPAIQQARIKVEDRSHPSSCFLPNNWQRVDEWYNFKANPRANVQVLASIDESTYQGGTMGDHPVIWCHSVGKGRSWYTNLGHRTETYHEELFLKSLREGVLWAAQSHRLQKWPALGAAQQLADFRLHFEFDSPALGASVVLGGACRLSLAGGEDLAWNELGPSDCGGVSFTGPGRNAQPGIPALRNAQLGHKGATVVDLTYRAARNGSAACLEEARINGIVVQHGVMLPRAAAGASRIEFKNVKPTNAKVQKL